MAGSPRVAKWYDDSFIRWIIGAAVALTLVHVALWLFTSREQVIVVIPAFLPAVIGFAVLASMAIAFLCSGRYLVLRRPESFWLGVAFSGYALLNLFYILASPSLVLGGAGVIGQLYNTSAWISFLSGGILSFLLVVAVLARWPGAGTVAERWWLWLWLAVMMLLLVIVGLSLAFEPNVPLLLRQDRTRTSLYIGGFLAIALMNVAGVVLAAHRCHRTGDSLFGILALTQLVLVFVNIDVATLFIAFSALWYLGVFLTIPAVALMLFGLLSEYVGLYRRERQRTRELEEERNRLQTVLDNAPVGITFYIAPEGRLELDNRAAKELAGGDLAGGLLREQVAVRDVRLPNGEPFPVDQLPVNRSLRGETVIAVDMLIHKPSGEAVYILVNSAPLRDAEGHIVGVVLISQDITPIKEQEMLRDEFISAAAHELKTPVTTIKGYVELMRRWTPQERETREPQAIEVINTQVNRINRRVQELLEAVRLRKSPPELRRVPFDLGGLVSEVVRRMQAMTESHRFGQTIEGPVPVEADRERIEEVLVCLLDNAMKYSPAGGDIEVRVWRQNGKALVSVRDHGVGIPKDRQRYVFRPFYEPVPSGAPGYRGVVALSLYLSKLNVERHGGEIWFESEEGKGSTFYFSLPLARVPDDGPRAGFGESK